MKWVRVVVFTAFEIFSYGDIMSFSGRAEVGAHIRTNFIYLAVSPSIKYATRSDTLMISATFGVLLTRKPMPPLDGSSPSHK